MYANNVSYTLYQLANKHGYRFVFQSEKNNENVLTKTNFVESPSLCSTMRIELKHINKWREKSSKYLKSPTYKGREPLFWTTATWPDTWSLGYPWICRPTRFEITKSIGFSKFLPRDAFFFSPHTSLLATAPTRPTTVTPHPMTRTRLRRAAGYARASRLMGTRPRRCASVSGRRQSAEIGCTPVVRRPRNMSAC